MSQVEGCLQGVIKTARRAKMMLALRAADLHRREEAARHRRGRSTTLACRQQPEQVQEQLVQLGGVAEAQAKPEDDNISSLSQELVCPPPCPPPLRPAAGCSGGGGAPPAPSHRDSSRPPLLPRAHTKRQ